MANENEAKTPQPTQLEPEVKVYEIETPTQKALDSLKVNFEKDIDKKGTLAVISQKFRESDPPLLASSLLSGPDRQYAIEIALFQYPDLAKFYINSLEKGGPDADKANESLRKLSKNLDSYINSLLEKEELQGETLMDDFTKHTGGSLKKVADEFKRHPMAALIGAGMLVGALSMVWGSGEKAKKWMKNGLIGGGIVGGGLILGNMLVRSQTDDGRDLWDILGFKPEDLKDNDSNLDRIASKYPGLNLENDQSARDLMRMLDSDCGDIYTVFSKAFNKGGREINPAQLARMSGKLKSKYAKSMNGKASYSALESYFVLLAEKTYAKNKTALPTTERGKVEIGLRIFEENFVNTAQKPNLNTAILMTIDKKDARAVAGTVGILGEGMIDAGLDETETLTQKRITDAFKNKGLDTWIDGTISKPVQVEVMPGLTDGASYVKINGFPWEYKYDSTRELHSFKTRYQGKDLTLYVGKDARTNIGQETQKVVQQRVNDSYPGHSILDGKDKFTYDVNNKEWVAKESIASPSLTYLGLQGRERHVALVFKAGQEIPAVRIQESNDKTGTTSFASLEGLVNKERVLERVKKDLNYITGSLNLQVLNFSKTADAEGKGAVEILWGKDSRKGTLVFQNQELIYVKLLEDPNEIPVELKNEWEALAERDADRLVQNNSKVQHVLDNLSSAFVGKQDYPNITDFRDTLKWIGNPSMTSRNAKWMEAIAFQQSSLHAEVKRAIIEKYSSSIDPVNGTSGMFRESERNRIIKTDIVDGILQKRLEKLDTLARSIAGSTGSAGDLGTMKEAKTEELRSQEMTPEYTKWLKSFDDVLKNKVSGIRLDSVGTEGFETSRAIHDAILLTIIDYTSPMHRDATVFNSIEAQQWRSHFEQNFPVIISRAIQNSEGSWWVDQRYNTKSFMQEMENAGIKAWQEVDLSSIVGSLDTNIKVPFYSADYVDSRGKEKEKVEVSPHLVPVPVENEDTLTYKERVTTYLQDATISAYADIDGIEKSFTASRYDNFLSWRMARVMEEFNDFLDKDKKNTTNEMIQEEAQNIVSRLREEKRQLSRFEIFQRSEGFTDFLSPSNADAGVLREVEREILSGMIKEDVNYREEWQKASREVMDWFDAKYTNKEIFTRSTSWIRQDIMKTWMQKIEYGDVHSTDTEIAQYRTFFTAVVETQLTKDNIATWQKAQGRLNAMPDFKTWKALNIKEPNKWTREESLHLNWELEEKVQTQKAIYARAEQFMDHFDDKIDVSKWTRIDGRWPSYFREHAENRLEIDVLPKVDNLAELEVALTAYEQALRAEAIFYDKLIDAKVKVTDEKGKLIEVPLLIALTIGGASVAAFITGLNPIGIGAGGFIGYTAGKTLNEFTGVESKKIHALVREKIDKQFDTHWTNKTPETFDAGAYGAALDESLTEWITKLEE